MPTYKITLPGGETYRVESPSELTDAQAYAAVQSQVSNGSAQETGRGGVLPSLAEGFVTSFTGIPLGVAGLFTARPEETTAGKFSLGAEKVVQDILGIDPTKEATTAEAVAGGLGSLASFFVPGTLAAKGAKALGAGAKAASALGYGATALQASPLSTTEGVQRIMAREAATGEKVSDEDRLESQRLNAVVGLSELIPLGRFLGPLEKILAKVPLSKASGASKTVADGVKSALRSATEEGAQEALAQTAQNLIEQGYYNPDLDITEGLLGSAGVGGAAGGTLDVILQLMAGRKAAGIRRRETQLQTTLAKQGAEKRPEQIRADANAGLEKLRAAAPVGNISIKRVVPSTGTASFNVVREDGTVASTFSTADAAVLAAEQYEKDAGGLAKFNRPTVAEMSGQTAVKPTKQEKAEGKKLAKALEQSGGLAPAPAQTPTTPAGQAAAVQGVAQVADATGATPAEVASPTKPITSRKKRIAPVEAPPAEGLPSPERIAAPPVSTTAAEIPAPERAAAEEAPSAFLEQPATEQPSALFDETERQDEGRLFSVPPAAPVSPTEAPPAAVQAPKAPKPSKPFTTPIKALFKPIANTPEDIAKLADFNNRKKVIAKELNKRLAPITGKQTRVKLVDAVSFTDKAGRTVFAEGEAEGGNIIYLSYNLYDPKLTNEQLVDKLFDVMNHEVIHSLTNLGVFKPGETKTLFNAAERTKYQGNQFSYYDRAYAMYSRMPNMTEEIIREEAVAEMFRDYRSGKLKLEGTPKGLVQRAIEFFRRIFSGFRDAKVGQIFKDIEAGKIGARTPTQADAKADPKAFAESKRKFSIAPEDEPIVKSMERAVKDLKGIVNCQLAVQTASGVSNLASLPRVGSAEVGDIIKIGVSHYAIKLSGDKVIDVEGWGQPVAIRSIDELGVPAEVIYGEDPEGYVEKLRPPAGSYARAVEGGVRKLSALPEDDSTKIKLAQEADNAFTELAGAQRGEPELYMVFAQNALRDYESGPALTYAMEHVGDLTHRMAQYGNKYPSYEFGIEFVVPKVRTGLRVVTNRVDAERIAKLPDDPTLKKYADAHSKLKVYNEAQRAARDAAVALGRKDLKEAERNLLILQEMIDNGTYVEIAGSYDPNYEDTRLLGIRPRSKSRAEGGVRKFSAMPEDERTKIRLARREETLAKAKQVVDSFYEEFPPHPFNRNQLAFQVDDSEGFVVLELEPEIYTEQGRKTEGVVHVKWLQAYPMRSGLGRKGMELIQERAREAGVAITLEPYEKGVVGLAGLNKFYKKMGFRPRVKGDNRHLIWRPEEQAEGGVRKFSIPAQDVKDLRVAFDQADSRLGPLAGEAVKNFVGYERRLPDREYGYGSGIMIAEDLERVARGQDPQAAAELEAAFAPVREYLRKKFGNTIKLYRYQRPIDPDGKVPLGFPDRDRAVLSWTVDESVAKEFAGVRGKKRNLITEEEIRKAEKDYEKTGEARFPKSKTSSYLVKEEDPVYGTYIGIYNDNSGGFVTDAESVRSFVNDVNSGISEFNADIDEAMKTVAAKEVPIDDIIYATDRVGQMEFMVLNRGEKYFDKTGQRKFSIPAQLTGESEQEFARWFGDSKAVDKDGSPLLLYRGLTLYGDQLESGVDTLEPSKGRAAFASPNPQLASSYAREDGGSVVPFYIKAEKLIEFPSRGDGSFDMFEFDTKAKRLKPGEVMVVRNVRDAGPAANLLLDPEGKANKPSDVYAFGNGTSVKSAFNEFAPGAAESRKFSIPAQLTGESEQEFTRWFKQSKAVDRNGKPRVYYHGRPRPLREGQFNRGASGALPGEEGPYYFSPDAFFASDYADLDLSKGGDRKRTETGTMYPVFLSVQNPWDYEKASNVDDVIEYIAAGIESGKIPESDLSLLKYGLPETTSLKKIGIYIEDGDWDAIELPAVQRAIRDLGFDGFYLVEDGVRNLAVYKPQQIKSIYNQFKPGTAESRKLSVIPPYPDDTTSTVYIREAGPSARLKPSGKVTVGEIAKAFDAITGKSDITDPADYNRIVDAIVKEVEYQKQQAQSGVGWYDNDVDLVFKILSETFPQFSDPFYGAQNRQLFTIIAGVMSNGMKARPNVTMAAINFANYMNTGKFSEIHPFTGKGWNQRTNIMSGQIRMLNSMMADPMFNVPAGSNMTREEKFLEWVFSEHPVREINQMRAKHGVKSPAKIGGVDTMRLGAYAFGPKFGPFILNLNGRTDETVDSWASRSFYRHMGRLLAKNGTKTNDAPLTGTDREAMKRALRDIADKTNLSSRDVQAVLWFYEKALYNDLGMKIPLEVFSDGARDYVNQFGKGKANDPTADDRTRAIARAGEEAGTRTTAPTPGGVAESEAVAPELKIANEIAEAAARSGEATQAEADIANQAVRDAIRKLSTIPEPVPMPASMEEANKKIFAATRVAMTPVEKIMGALGGLGKEGVWGSFADQIRVNLVQKSGQIGKRQRELYLSGKLNREDAGIAEFDAVAADDMYRRASHYTVEIAFNGAPVILGLTKDRKKVLLRDGGDPNSAYMEVEMNQKDSLFKVLEMLITGGPNGGDLTEQFRSYALAIVSQRRLAEGKDIPEDVTPEYIEQALALAEQYPIIKEAFDMYQRFNTKLIEAVRDSGYLSQKLFEEFTDQQNYYSMYRQLEEGDVVQELSGGLASRIRFKAYEGSITGNLMADPIVAMMHNLSFWNNVILRTIATQKAYRVGILSEVVKRLRPFEDDEGNVTIEEPSRAEGYDPRVFYTYINGQEIAFASKDPLFTIGLSGNEFVSPGTFLTLAGMPANWLREAVTRDPGFVFANLLRDSMSTWVLAGSGANPLQTFKGFVSALKSSSSFEALRSHAVVGSFDEAQKPMEKIVSGMRQKLTKVQGLPTMTSALTGAWRKLGSWSEASDAATRIAVYEAAKRDGATDFTAAYRALSIMNFSRSGHSAGLRAWTRMVPFLNARIQGFDVLYTGLKAATGVLTGREQLDFERQRGTHVLVRGMALTAAAMALSLLLDDDEEYQQLPQYIKDANILIPIPGQTGKYFQIPKPFEAGFLFMTVPQAFYDVATGDRSMRSATKLMFSQFSSTFGFNPIPQAFLPAFENLINRDFYTGQPLISAGMEKLDPSLQYGASTSYVARGISQLSSFLPLNYDFEEGRFVPISPIMIDNLISGYGGPIVSYIAMGAGSVAYAYGSDNQGLPVAGSQLPFIRRFFVDARDKQPQAATEAYELYQLVDKVNRTMSRLKKMGDREALQEYREENINILRVGKQVRKMADNLNNIRAQMRRLEADKVTPMNEKLEKMRELRAREARVTRKIDEINQQLGR